MVVGALRWWWWALLDDGGHSVKVGAGGGHWVSFVNGGRGGWVEVVFICLWIVVDACEGHSSMVVGTHAGW